MENNEVHDEKPCRKGSQHAPSSPGLGRRAFLKAVGAAAVTLPLDRELAHFRVINATSLPPVITPAAGGLTAEPLAAQKADPCEPCDGYCDTCDVQCDADCGPCDVECDADCGPCDVACDVDCGTCDITCDPASDTPNAVTLREFTVRPDTLGPMWDQLRKLVGR